MPASGKSQTAKLLAELLGYKLLSKDQIQTRLYNKYGFNNHDEKLALMNKADFLLKKKIFQEIKKKK